MADHVGGIYDCDACDEYCDGCKYAFHQLVDRIVKDIQRLEADIVYLRYTLIPFLSKHNGQMLKFEIFSDLAGRYDDHPAYQQYVAEYCGGQDPMDSYAFNQHIQKISKGKAKASYIF
jgi:hypothetical protein